MRAERGFILDPDGNVYLEPVAVYRLFTAAGELLYVGISCGPEQRFREHAKTKPWWDSVARHEIEWFDSRAEAAAAEVAAVRDEHPRYDRTHRMGAGWRKYPSEAPAPGRAQVR